MKRLQRAVAALHRWYGASARELPWRRTRDPYAIWISEVMLQQTQVATARPYFERWMEVFPDLQSLARADADRVLKQWEGLGYYRRARNLLRAARQIASHHGGVIPATPEGFGALPGVGPYTAAAVLSIAFDLDLAVVDGNVRRVLSRLAALERDPRRGPGAREVERLARELLPPGKAALHNQALMELGALICTPRAPACGACPLAGACRAHARGDPERYPLRAPRRRVPHRHLEVALVLDDAGALLVDRRPYRGFLGGLWELPKAEREPARRPGTAIRRVMRERYGIAARKRRGGELAPVEHAYSHLRVTLHAAIYDLRRRAPRAAEAVSWRWIEPARLPGEVALAGADRKLLERFGQRFDQRQ